MRINAMRSAGMDVGLVRIWDAVGGARGQALL